MVAMIIPFFFFRTFMATYYHNDRLTDEPHHKKTRLFAYAKTKAQISCAVTAQLICAFVFATRTVQYLFFFTLLL